MLVENGVRAIWNFAHTDLNLPEHIIVENVHLSESLMQLSYNISRYNEEHQQSVRTTQGRVRTGMCEDAGLSPCVLFIRNKKYDRG